LRGPESQVSLPAVQKLSAPQIRGAARVAPPIGSGRSGSSPPRCRPTSCARSPRQPVRNPPPYAPKRRRTARLVPARDRDHLPQPNPAETRGPKSNEEDDQYSKQNPTPVTPVRGWLPTFESGSKLVLKTPHRSFAPSTSCTAGLIRSICQPADL